METCHVRVLATLALVTLAACSSPSSAAPAGEPPPGPRVRVRTTPVIERPVAPTIRATGLVVAKEQALLSFEVPGVVRDVRVHAGDRVRPGHTGNTLSFTATIGFIALTGIEVKNSILLVDFTSQLRAGGMALDAAIARAGEARFVPILLTTLTALGGLVPLALERSPLYSPLAWVIVGGLVTSTVLTRVVTPVMYKLLAPEIETGKDGLEELHGFARATGA